MWDIFISHASEDKDQVVRPLAEELRQRGLTVWYDEFSLTLGDSLRQTIDEGLAQSRFGVVVLSRSFFAKEWPQRELGGLISREASVGKVILPILHGVSYEDLAKYSPILADRLAIRSEKGVRALAEAIENAVRDQARPSDLAREVYTQPFIDPPSIAHIATANSRIEVGRKGKRSLSMVAAVWASARSKTIPTLTVLWIQWILVVFLLYVDSLYLGLFGFLSPLWLVPLSYLTARFMARDTSVARVVGGVAGGIISAAFGVSLGEWGPRYGVVFGVFFGTLLSAHFSAPANQTKVIWAFLSTMLLIGLELLHYSDFYRYIPDYAFVGTVFPVVIGFLLVFYARLYKRFQEEKVDKDRQSDDLEDDAPPS
ncbi:MAG TPA: toll/interleukin-1 receptor domain-containing protein [Thermoanaerobaculia bacterium]|jgi:hypothetical protein|nr:toll/interleukin-1 receptor domain-containing protein [Thermoanaerobaculia bacterium]